MRGLIGFAAVVAGVPLAVFLMALWATGVAPLGSPEPVPNFAARIDIPAAPVPVRHGDPGPLTILVVESPDL